MKHYNPYLFLHKRLIFLLGILFFILTASVPEGKSPVKLISHSFELRYFSDDPTANGETDFKSGTGIFDTEDRITFLQQYADYASRFFNDQDMDKLVVTEKEVLDALLNLKPQPLPAIRKSIPLTDWKYTGKREGQREAEISALSDWNKRKGLKVENGTLVFADKRSAFSYPIASQDWRMRMEWKFFLQESSLPLEFALDSALIFGVDANGKLSFVSSGNIFQKVKPDLKKWHRITIELDMETGRYNLLFNDEIVADFVELSAPSKVVNHWHVKAGRGLQIDDIWGVSYRKTYDPEGHHNTRDVPFSINTIIDEDFQVRPDIYRWQHQDYDDSGWMPVPRWPYAHGGERFRDEFLYLRTNIEIGQFEHALLKVETISPSGEIWVNGRIVHVQHNQHPNEIDVTEFLLPGKENHIAVRVSPDKVKFTNRHTPDDIYTGWFAGRMWLELTDKRRIKDLYVFTERIDGDTATLNLEVDIRNDHVLFPEERERKGSNTYEGTLNINVYKWFPEEINIPAASGTFPVSVYLGQDKKWTGKITVPSPELWTPEKPALYKIVASLSDEKGKVFDDYVITTGIRTISQDGGTFRINGEPAMMNGALSAAFRAPLDKISQWFRCGPEENIMEELMMLKKMNANTMRMTLNDGVNGNINDPRYAEIGDQIGIMFQWGTTAWVRTDSPYLVDFEGLPKYVRQVRNHPSIVMWQPANHPYINGFKDAVVWMEKIYNAIAPNDLSRLISPTASSSQQRIQPPNDDGTLDHTGNPAEPEAIWTAPMITRGNMDFATGYGAEWNTLRMFPYPPRWTGEQNWLEAGYRTDYLASKDRAYFDYESEESIGQPNWSLHKGKPQYRIQSYELFYDNGSIGRILTPDEWKISQAWQAMSGYEAYRKKRWLDYDGQTWCNLRGGHNTATYQKPLIDYYGHAKMAFYAIKMVFQPVLAGSRNVDMVYGPEDKFPVVVMNMGKERLVNVTAKVKDMNGVEVFSHSWNNILLLMGRSFTDITGFHPKVPENGTYAIEYIVEEIEK